MKSSKLEVIASTKLKGAVLKVRIHPHIPEMCVISHRNDTATILALDGAGLTVTRTYGSGRRVKPDDPAEQRYLGACYSPSGKVLGLVGKGRAIELWQQDEVQTVGFSQTDPQALIERKISIYRGMSNEAEMAEHIRRIFADPAPETYTGVCFTKDESCIMATGHSRGTQLFAMDGSMVAQLQGGPELVDNVLHPEGRLLAHIENLWGDWEGEVYWGYLENGSCYRRLGRCNSLSAHGPHGGCFSPDGRTLVIVGNEDVQHYAAIDVVSGKFLYEWADGVSPVKDPPDDPFFFPCPERIVFHPDSSRFLLPFGKGLLLEVDTRSGEPIAKYETMAGIVSCDVSYAQGFIAAASSRGEITVYRLPYEGEPQLSGNGEVTDATLRTAQLMDADSDTIEYDEICNDIGLKFIEKL